jgi:Transposase DDE domain
VNRLGQFWHYTGKVFDLPRRLRAVRAERCQPDIPTPAVTASLFLGGLLRVKSFLQLQAETSRRGWQRVVGYDAAISDDTLARATERYHLEDLRQVLVGVNRQLKANKALEQAKINGLLVVALDANEQFSSRHRCCEACSQRTIKEKDAAGQVREVTEYYHRQVYAQMHGPGLSVILDLEPVRPGEEEAQAALRLLGRMRRLYGPRFFDVITVDAWYATGPFITAVRRLGWAVVSVLKQERYEIYQEATALSRGQRPQTWTWKQRAVQVWEVKDLPFTEPGAGLLRVVIAQENWAQRHGAQPAEPKECHWRWLADSQLDGYPAQTIWQIGHQRWGVENHAFNELTQHYHLTHCPHHHPVGILAWLLFLVLAFNLFELFVRLHGKLWRQGRTTLQEIARQLDRALEAAEQLQPLWSG